MTGKEGSNVKRLLISCTALFLAFSLASIASAQPFTFFDFDGDGNADSSWFVPTIGDSFIADVYISDIDTTHGGLLSMGLQLTFDNTLVKVLSLAADDTNWNIPDLENVKFDNAAGIASIAGGTILGGLTGTILLGSIEFQCMGAGVFDVIMGELLPDDPTFNAFVAIDDFVYDKIIDYGFASVNQVPIPGTLFLLLSGLIGLVVLRRREAN
jgi:hypothetical protein